MSRPIVVYGAGGHGREIAALIGDIRRSGVDWDLQGFLDDDPARWGTVIGDLPVLGDGEWAGQRPGMAVALGIGHPAGRCQVAAGLDRFPIEFPPLIHPRAIVMERSAVGRGCVASAGTVVTVDVVLGEFAVLNILASVSHDCRLAPFATLGPGVTLPGGVTIGAGTDLGARVCAVPRVTVGEWAIIGAGAVVASDLPANCTAVGVPARISSQRAPGWHLGTRG